jgi:hypothetical protein
MSRRSRNARRLILGGTALAGLVGAHALDYTLLIPNAAARRAILHQTGHGYFQSVVELALAAAVVAAIASMVTGYRRGRSREGSAPTFVDWAWSLGWIQVAGFVLLEFGERFAAHAGLHHYADSTIYVGVLIQILAACLGAGLLVLLDRVAEHVAQARSRPVSPIRPARSWPRPALDTVVPPRFARPGLVRAPPSVPA